MPPIAPALRRLLCRLIVVGPPALLIACSSPSPSTSASPAAPAAPSAAAPAAAGAKGGPATPADPARAPFTFALIGDTPYSDSESTRFDAMIARINREPGLAFVLHAGDIKGGGQPCTDDLLRQRFAQLTQFRLPLVYTPGDNEWTDCHRSGAGRFHPLERLQFLRGLFFPNPHRALGGGALAVVPQSDTPGREAFVENVRFVHHGVVFATLHVVGSKNDLEPWSGIDAADSMAAPRPDRLAAYRAREAAALAWLDATFVDATARRAPAVVLLMQANPEFERGAGDARRAGFNTFIARLRERALAFGRPVLLAHGDFHEYRVDRPYGPPGRDVPDLVRVETFGSPQVGWVKITVDPAAAAPFAIAPGPQGE